MSTSVELTDTPRWRPRLGQEGLLLLSSILVSLLCNPMFWHAAASGRAWSDPGTWRFLAGTFAVVVAVHFLLFSLLATRRSIKPLLGLLAFASVAAMVYMQQYTVYLDAAMMRNVLHTQSKEAFELLSPGLIGKVLLGVLPAWALLAWIELRPRGWKRALGQRALALGGAVVLAVVGVLLAYQELSSLLRNQREVRYLVTPANLIVSTLRVLIDDAHQVSRERIAIGTDAHRLVRVGAARPRLLVLVVGETVRAQNWGLNGYERQTTPELALREPINFPDVEACGSSTEVSLPCMFSAVGRRDYDEDRIRSQQSLLHVLDHAGVASDWIDNQTGCKHVCDGLPREDIRGDEDPALCDGKICLDELLIERVRARLDALQGDAVIVLHPLGNHGPSYSRRYPPAFRRYTPTCESADFGDCDSESIRNAYDNALLYTDHVLARLIDLLQQHAGHDTALLYVSDHGESLGENGLYLHGVPHAIAPDQQLKVPMALWLSPGLQTAAGIDRECLARNAARPHAHDHLFHSVLGLFDVATAVYEPEWDLFRDCRPGARQTAGQPGSTESNPS